MMITSIRNWSVAAALLATLCSCNIPRFGPIPRLPYYAGQDVRGVSYRAVDKLLRTSRCPKDCIGVCGERDLCRAKGLVVATVQNLDNLKTTTGLGRLLKEFLSTRLTHHGYRVYHMRAQSSDAMIIERSGEFLQSRDVRRIKPLHEVGGVLLSNYIVAADKVHVSLKLLTAEDQSVLSAWDYQLEADDPQVADLLKGREAAGFAHSSWN